MLRSADGADRALGSRSVSAIGRVDERHSFIEPSQSLRGGKAVEFRMSVKVLRRGCAQDGEIGIYLVSRLFFCADMSSQKHDIKQ